jgi:ABC-2 type transport system ATP-binding protein
LIDVPIEDLPSYVVSMSTAPSLSQPTQTLAAATERPGTAVLELEDLYHRWKGPNPPVLDGVSLTLYAGEVAWIGGRNGAGKTTLLRLAAGIFLPERGTVRLGEMTPRSAGRHYRRQIGFLSAGDRSLIARMSVTSQLDYWARLAYVPRAQRDAVVARGLERFELEELAQRRSDRLSMGQRQRLRLAMVFMHEPQVVLLDEPRNSLDDDGYRMLKEQVELAAARGAAVLWCSPRGEDQVLGCDHAFTLQDGCLEPAR